MKVLVVEDDPNLRALWGAVIERAGHAPVLSETESDARHRLTSEPFDLVLLDLCLNGSDGGSIAGVATHLNPECRVAVVTGTSLHTRAELFAMAPSVWAVMRKPVDIEDVLSLCARVADGDGVPLAGDAASGGAEFRS